LEPLSQQLLKGEQHVRLLTILIGLTAITVGLGGVFANIAYGEGLIAAIGIGISLITLCLGVILLYMGLRKEWSY
jgi:vacuolar-type H+-ATPase subunit I/STV1